MIYVAEAVFYIVIFFGTLAAGWDAFICAMLSYRSVGEDVCIAENLSESLTCTRCSIVGFLSKNVYETKALMLCVSISRLELLSVAIEVSILYY